MSLKRRLSVRSSVDLKDVRQVRALKKRFRVTHEELSRIVERAGASIAGIGKEVALQRAGRLPQPAENALRFCHCCNGQRCRDATHRWVAAGLT